ncbi:olfactory receptor 11L1 [Xenopus laevis]|uniref:Olfactory receptor n=2 Tax=Xenopus laevis TaxID=8355 RepID=A0A1L8H446_XENLA|nr:olfactory receptor 11L1 [Xenopus laevis]OCT90865.1 hypothetical protein XELAEV_18019482mg [Xenopus laevis]
MCEGNQTTVFVFVLLGFPIFNNLRFYFFTFFLFIYIFILTENLTIVTLLSTNCRLYAPMFFFLKQLALCDLFLTTNTVPKLLEVIWLEGSSISFSGCIAQFYLHSVAGIVECFILTVMSYDRYLAICNPFHYVCIMNYSHCLNLAVWSWLLGFLVMVLEMLLIWNLQFCGSNVIDHFFCDFAPLLELSSSDISTVVLEDFVFSMPVIVCPFMFILGTYIFILIAILKITSKDGRKKAFSTCSSHLAIVCTYYGTLIAVYVVPSEGLNINKFRSLLYIMLTPLFNPLIYSLRNVEIKGALQKLVNPRKKIRST